MSTIITNTPAAPALNLTFSEGVSPLLKAWAKFNLEGGVSPYAVTGRDNTLLNGEEILAPEYGEDGVLVEIKEVDVLESCTAYSGRSFKAVATADFQVEACTSSFGGVTVYARGAADESLEDFLQVTDACLTASIHFVADIGQRPADYLQWGEKEHRSAHRRLVRFIDEWMEELSVEEEDYKGNSLCSFLKELCSYKHLAYGHVNPFTSSLLGGDIHPLEEEVVSASFRRPRKASVKVAKRTSQAKQPVAKKAPVKHRA